MPDNDKFLLWDLFKKHLKKDPLTKLYSFDEGWNDARAHELTSKHCTIDATIAFRRQRFGYLHSELSAINRSHGQKNRQNGNAGYQDFGRFVRGELAAHKGQLADLTRVLNTTANRLDALEELVTRAKV